jgi:hypothetical protein
LESGADRVSVERGVREFENRVRYKGLVIKKPKNVKGGTLPRPSPMKAGSASTIFSDYSVPPAFQALTGNETMDIEIHGEVYKVYLSPTLQDGYRVTTNDSDYFASDVNTGEYRALTEDETAYFLSTRQF